MTLRYVWWDLFIIPVWWLKTVLFLIQMTQCRSNMALKWILLKVVWYKQPQLCRSTDAPISPSRKAVSGGWTCGISVIFWLKSILYKMGMLKKTKLPESIRPAASPNHTKLVMLRRSDAWSLWGQDEETGLPQAVSPCPGQTQLQIYKAVASPCCLDHIEHFAMSLPF